jgi:hypothetical protein
MISTTSGVATERGAVIDDMLGLGGGDNGAKCA